MSTRNPDGTMPDPDHLDALPKRGRKRHRGGRGSSVSDELMRLRAEIEKLRAEHAAEIEKLRADHAAEIEELRAEHAAADKTATTALMTLQHVRRELDIYKGEIAVRIESIEDLYDEIACANALIRYRKICIKASRAIVVPQLLCSWCKCAVEGDKAMLMFVPFDISGGSMNQRVFCTAGELNSYIIERRRQNEWLQGPPEITKME